MVHDPYQASNIFRSYTPETYVPQNRKDDLKSYKHLHGIYIKIHSLPKQPDQKIYDMGLSNLHGEEFKLFAMEYNFNDSLSYNNLEYYVNTLQHHNEDYSPGMN
jgi:hypothetical protein